MHRHHNPRSMTALVLIAAVLAAPIHGLTRWVDTTATRLREEEDGLSETTSVVLMAALLALVVVIVVGLIQGWATNEANNLPTSGGG